MSNFNINFASTEDGLIKIDNLSTACVIRITVQPSEPEMGERLQEVFLDYERVRQLVKAIDNIKE